MGSSEIKKALETTVLGLNSDSDSVTLRIHFFLLLKKHRMTPAQLDSKDEMRQGM